MAKTHLTISAGALALFFAIVGVGDADGVDATSLRLSADAAITGVWIDGQPATLGNHAKDWTQADDFGSHSGLRALAVIAQNGTEMGHAGFIGTVVLKDGRWVVTDRTWRAWKGDGAPPTDAKGRSWTAADYDDSSWPMATEIGTYGIGPWGSNTQTAPKTTPLSKLDDAMRQIATAKLPEKPKPELAEGAILPAGTDISALLRAEKPAQIAEWNATWIWAGPPLGGAPIAYFRKTFIGGAGIPPTKPQYAHLTATTPTSFTLAWQPSFSAQGPVRYELAWNGQVMLTTNETSGTIDGLTINPLPQNYAWVQAVAPDGTRSARSSCVLISTPATDVPEATEHVRVTDRSPNGVSLAWDPAKDSGALKSYEATIGDVACFVPPGVCSLAANFPKFILPGATVKIKIAARGSSGKLGPATTLEDSTAPLNPLSLPEPTGLRIESGKLVWDATPGATAYRLWRDGMAVPGLITATTAPIPAGETNGFVRVRAMDDAKNLSPLSPPLVIGKPAKPDAPAARDAGHSGDTVVLRWSRPAVGTCVGYRIEIDQGGNWTPIAQIDDPWQNEYIAGKRESYQSGPHDALPSPLADALYEIKPGTAYRFRVVALAPDRSEVPGAPVAITTVAPPSPEAKLRFAVIVATDGRYDFLDKSLTDADEAQCAFALIKGQIVPQISHDPKQWDMMLETVRKHPVKSIFALLASKDGWNEINDFNSMVPGDDELSILGRYDMGPWRTGQPLDQFSTELNGALHLVSFVENAHSNPDFLPDLERGLQDGEADPACRWLFTTGVSTESAPTGIVRVMEETTRPTVDFMRMINGDRGHELAQDTGSNVVCACPQRNRVGAHYLVMVEDKRIVLESRQYDKKAAAFVTDGLQEIAYDRDANTISAANLRIPYPFGIVPGFPQRADNIPPWTQNRIVSCLANGQTEIALLGHTARSTPLTFTVTRKPTHGTLTGEGDKLTYHPTPNFTGEDLFLYRADDGSPSPGNTAWVRINVKEEAEK